MLKPIADKLCARIIYMCMLPFALVEKVHFKNFVSEGLRCVYTFPTRRSLAGSLLNTEYEAYISILKSAYTQLAWLFLGNDKYDASVKEIRRLPK